MKDDDQVFELANLEVGSPLRCDIEQTNGNLLARRGDVITQELQKRWAQKGITLGVVSTPPSALDTSPPKAPPSTTAESSSETRDDEDEKLLRPYDESALQRLEESFSEAEVATLEVAELLATDELKNCGRMVESIEGFLAEVELDIAAVLSSMHVGRPEPQSEKDLFIAKRSAKLAVMALVICTDLKFHRDDCQMACLAGMLHDISLFEQTQAAVSEAYGLHRDPQQHYRDHPIQSASLLTYVNGISDQTRHIMAQVHEEPNGGGFPRGLLKHRIHRLAKVLHLVDAYLTLTNEDQPTPFPVGRNLLPADAIAYLLHHASQGHFDVDMMRGLVNATSLYPVGSIVEFDDHTTATVLRSSSLSSPSQPIVRMDKGDCQIIDLRQSPRSISRPVGLPGSDAKRIQTSQLDEILWRATPTENS